MKTTHYRQGDVLIVPVAEIPEGLNRVKGDRVVLAHGEVTGHAHALDARSAVGYAPSAEPETEVSYLEIAEAVADLAHEEHDTISLPRGKYKIVHQREYSPEEIRRVLD